MNNKSLYPGKFPSVTAEGIGDLIYVQLSCFLKQKILDVTA